MADVRPFRALRYDPAAVNLANTIAPPYDVISPALQDELYERDPHNIVRIEYGREQPDDGEASNKYARAAADLRSWRARGELTLDSEPAIYRYRQRFTWAGKPYERTAHFAAVRLEEWEKGVVRPHEHTMSTPKADRMNLLRATRTQVSAVFSLFRPRKQDGLWFEHAETPEIAVDAYGEQHLVDRVTDGIAVADFARLIAESDVYIADGHHRYETALAYRDEVRARSSSWSGDEPENFVLMALTAHDDPGLLVLPTHRLLYLAAVPDDTLERVSQHFDVTPVESPEALPVAVAAAGEGGSSFGIVGVGEGPVVVTLRERAAVESLMPADQPEPWKRLDVNVLQYGVLERVLGIDEERLRAGDTVTYTQDERAAIASVQRGDARVAFLLNATPVEQVLAVADAGGRMPQKSTYFQPKLPTGLVLRALD